MCYEVCVGMFLTGEESRRHMPMVDMLTEMREWFRWMVVLWRGYGDGRLKDGSVSICIRSCR